MAQVHFSDEVLMAFADGELDEQVAATVEQAMTSDPVAARRIIEFLRSRRLIRAAYSRETAADVPAELRAAVQAQIDRFEGHVRLQEPSGSQTLRGVPPAGRRLGTALAATVAAVAVATAGYLAGRQGLPSPPSDPMAYLAAPEVSRALSGSLSGQEQDLPFGRIRLISTFRMADGSLCREFKLQAPSGTADAVACRANEWLITFALASGTTGGAYVPSSGGDLMAGYLQNIGAGQPLLDAAEIEALREARPQR